MSTPDFANERKRSAPGEHEFEELTRITNELITTQRQLHQQRATLSKLNEEKNLALGIVAHDLRNPLALVKLQSELLLKEASASLSETHRELLESINDQGRLMLTIVNDLLDVATIDAGRFELDRSVVDIGKLLERLVRTHALLASQKEITIQFNQTDDQLIAFVDVNKFQQVLANLIGNAVKFSPVQSHIEVTLSKFRDSFEVRVRDHGPGISNNKLELLFRPFSTAGTAPSAGEKSTGLGLAIVRRIVEKHGGSIDVNSTVGIGTLFAVKIPLGATAERENLTAPQSPQQSETPREEQSSLDRKRVLIVDDCSAAAKMTARLLSSVGDADIEIARDGHSALEMVAEFEPHLVLLDIELPLMDGREVARRIQQEYRENAPFLCAVSAHSRSELEAIAATGSFDEILSKPIAIRDLNRLLTSDLRNSISSEIGVEDSERCSLDDKSQ